MSLPYKNSHAFDFRSILATIYDFSPYDFVISSLSVIVCVYCSYRSWRKRTAIISQYLLPYCVLTAFAQLAIISKSILLTTPSIPEAIFSYTSLACASWLLLIMIDVFLVFRREKFTSRNLSEHRLFMFRIYYFHSFLLLPIVLPIITTKPLGLEKLNTVAFVFYLTVRTLAVSVYSLFIAFTMWHPSGKRDHAVLVKYIVIFITAVMYVSSLPTLSYSHEIVSNCWLSHVSGTCTPKLCAFILHSDKFKMLCSLFWGENICIIVGLLVLDKCWEREDDEVDEINERNFD